MNRILALISLILIAFACEDYHYSAPPGDSKARPTAPAAFLMSN